MDWDERTNAVLDYIEHNLGGEIQEMEICRIAACPLPAFQAVFSQVADISLAEYIRRRRLTRAAYDLQNTRQSVLEIALKYGYQSADAFRVAFRRLHGLTPSEAREPGVTLTFYCRLRFALKLEGVDKMDYTILEKGPFRVAGVRRTTPYGGGTWAVVKGDGSNERARKWSGRFFDLGLCFGFGADGGNDYMCAVEWEGACPDGCDIYEYPAAVWLRFKAKGAISGKTLGSVWRRINEEFLPQSKYQKCGLPTIEKYIAWDEAADRCDVEIWIPVAQK